MDIWKITNIWTHEQLLFFKLSKACNHIGAKSGTIRNKLSKEKASQTTYKHWKIEKTKVCA